MKEVITLSVKKHDNNGNDDYSYGNDMTYFKTLEK